MDGANITAPVAAISRLRMMTDGDGVSTLVCFQGCPLRCKWCINPFTLEPEGAKLLTAKELYEKVRLDELYFLATGGGITFGGGEPLLRSAFLEEFRGFCPQEWHLCAETSLAVPWENVRQAARCIDMFYVDVKDTNPEIYRSYTGRDNTLALGNLKRLLQTVGPRRITVRLPLIPQYNTPADRQRSRQLLSEMGITLFDEFTYRLP